ncbi:MAG: hypothetical protein P0Y66_02815 [Candidatus Kaistia colombiensis]|nr:MAG: hypothetical protein P0Y66_02815 [Kaistia sp.]
MDLDLVDAARVGRDGALGKQPSRRHAIGPFEPVDAIGLLQPLPRRGEEGIRAVGPVAEEPVAVTAGIHLHDDIRMAKRYRHLGRVGAGP